MTRIININEQISVYYVSIYRDTGSEILRYFEERECSYWEISALSDLIRKVLRKY